MVIVVPVYEEEATGTYYNTAAVIDADGQIPRQVSQEPHPALQNPVSGRNFTSSPAISAIRCSRRRSAKSGVYICYDRHFPEGWRLLG